MDLLLREEKVGKETSVYRMERRIVEKGMILMALIYKSLKRIINLYLYLPDGLFFVLSGCCRTIWTYMLFLLQMILYFELCFGTVLCGCILNHNKSLYHFDSQLSFDFFCLTLDIFSQYQSSFWSRYKNTQIINAQPSWYLL